ncbi:variable surface protein [Plasmodium gonderi]|uniref:Variable surface protein n=1 Tax=Plasmodium gonderi TaxID=77519 RepID=A0A1Y1JPN5_PLAGO|nr:variable surface protein [Plasmodium gonderi]GAW84210.1 variable surface protein [Plasmodium gonderi]
MSDTLGDEVLNNLPTKKKYTIFDKKNEYCYNSYIENNAKNLLGNKGELANVSNKIYNALCYAYNQYKTKVFNSEDCNYLYFWLVDMLDKNLTDENSFYAAMIRLNFILEQASLSTCNSSIYKINPKNVKNIKILFDFSKDYDELKKHFPTSNKPCNGSFKLHLDGYVMKYTEFKNICNDSYNSHETCTAFKKYFTDKNNLNLTQWTCNLARNINDHAASQELGRMGQHTVQEKLLIAETYSLEQSRIHGVGEYTSEDIDEEIDKGMEGTTTEGREKEVAGIKDENIEGAVKGVEDIGVIYIGSAQKSGSDGGGAQKEAEVITAYPTYEQQIINTHSEDPSLDVNNTKSSTRIDFSAYSSSNTMVIASLFVGITVFFIILYKVIVNFSPFGYWLKKSLLRKYRRKHNIIMGGNTIRNYSISEDIDSPRRFSVKYNSNI